MTRLLRWPIRLLAGLMRVCVVAAMLLVLLSTVGQVIDRQFVKSSFGAYDQYGRLGLVWLTFLGIAIAVRERANIRIELLDHFLPAWAARVKGVVLDIVMTGVAVLLVVVGWPLLEVGSFQVIMDTPIDYSYVYAALLIAMAVLALFVAARLLNAASGGRLRLDNPPDAGSPHDPV